MSEAQKGHTHKRGWNLSEETLRKIKVARTGHKIAWHMKLAKRKFYIFSSPEGDVVCFFGLDEFCHIHGLQTSNMSMVFSGKQKSHRGWTRAIPLMSCQIPFGFIEEM